MVPFRRHLACRLEPHDDDVSAQHHASVAEFGSALMHELSVATALVAQAERALGSSPDARVVAVRIRLGALSGLVADSLQFGFEIAAQGTALQGARLEIERVPPVLWCSPCEAAVTLASTTRFRCPTCDTPSADILSGRELELSSLEIDDSPAPAQTSSVGGTS